MKIAILDLETGGFSSTKNGLVELACVIADENFVEVDSFRKLILPYKRHGEEELVSYKDDAMAIHGITMEEIMRDGFLMREVMEQFTELLSRHNITTVVGHNIKAFDLRFVAHLLERCDFDCHTKWILEDTMQIAKGYGNLKTALPNVQLPTLCAHFGIVNEKQHSGIGDCRATLQLFKILKT